MQEYKDGKLINSEELQGKREDMLKAIEKKFEKLAGKKIDHFCVGRLPEVNDTIKVHGLEYIIVEAKPDQFTAKICGIKGDDINDQENGPEPK